MNNNKKAEYKELLNYYDMRMFVLDLVEKLVNKHLKESAESGNSMNSDEAYLLTNLISSQFYLMLGYDETQDVQKENTELLIDYLMQNQSEIFEICSEMSKEYEFTNKNKIDNYSVVNMIFENYY